MAQANIPFRSAFKERLLDGRKTATTRTGQKGIQAGDTFEAFGATFRVTEVFPCYLANVKAQFWREEGCTSPEDFEVTWRFIHPRAGFRLTLPVFLFRFHKELEDA